MDVIPVSDRHTLRQFIDYPYRIYASDPLWVPPLRMEQRARFDRARDPFYEHAEVDFFTACEGANVVGRIAAIDDRLHQETHGDNVAAFGYFEARSADVACRLLNHVEGWARARGRAKLRGPLNPSLNDSAGLLVDGFDTPPMLMMPHNPESYGTYIEGAGFEKVKDLYAWRFDLNRPTDPRVARLAELVRAQQNLTVRTVRLDDFEAELQRFRVIYTRAWEHNWGFVPPTEREFSNLAKELKPVFDADLALCIEVEGSVVACILAIPDINQALAGTDGRLFPTGWWRLLNRRRIIDQVRVVLLGVLPEFRHLGLYPLLLNDLFRRRGHYRRAEFSWVLEDNNDINKPAAASGAVRYKTYRIYQKLLR
jgi:GNAT superfamily N-acetyltransferase